jgi:hypothetical protein
MDVRFFSNLLFGPNSYIPDSRPWDGQWYPEADTLGTFVIAAPGRGKTWLVAQYLLHVLKNVANASIFILDWSGDISNKLLYLIALEPYIEREKLLRKVIYDELGHQRFVLPTPEFSPLYGASTSEQVARVADNWEKLSGLLGQQAPVIGGMALAGLSPRIMEVIASINWQITEFPTLLDNPAKLSRLFGQYRDSISQPVREWLTNRFINLKQNEQELRSFALSKITGAILSPASIAKLGGSTPAYTPHEIIQNGGMLLFSGTNLINQKASQHYLFTQCYSLIMQEVNKRVPSDPNNPPLYLVFDEAYSIISNPGIAEDVGRIQSLYRSRNVRPIVIIQSLSQLAEPLDKQIWNMGNKIIGKVEEFNEAYTTAQEIFRYIHRQQKNPAVRENSQPVFEPDRGQYLQIANYIQHMQPREFFIKRFFSEANEDRFIRHISRTPEVPQQTPEESVASIKERLLRMHGRSVDEVMEGIKTRQAQPVVVNPQQMQP